MPFGPFPFPLRMSGLIVVFAFPASRFRHPQLHPELLAVCDWTQDLCYLRHSV